mgnify:CR=1 FL=1
MTTTQDRVYADTLNLLGSAPVSPEIQTMLYAEHVLAEISHWPKAQRHEFYQLLQAHEE